MAKQLGRFNVTPELMMQALKIPDGTVLHATSWNYYTPGGSFEIVVASPELYPVEEAAEIPVYTPLLIRNEDGSTTWKWGKGR